MTRPTLAEFRALMDEYGFACAWSPLTQERTAALHAKLFPPALPRQGLFHADADALVAKARDPECARFIAELKSDLQDYPGPLGLGHSGDGGA